MSRAWTAVLPLPQPRPPPGREERAAAYRQENLYRAAPASSSASSSTAHARVSPRGAFARALLRGLAFLIGTPLMIDEGDVDDDNDKDDSADGNHREGAAATTLADWHPRRNVCLPMPSNAASPSSIKRLELSVVSAMATGSRGGAGGPADGRAH